MATVRDSPTHEERTTEEPRHEDIHPVVVHDVQQVNWSTRIINLRIKDARKGIEFSSGQWLDTFIPGIPFAGGFTLTSTPYQALPAYEKHPYLQLAVRKAMKHPPAAWLWQDEKKIVGKEILVRVGGSFVWPPRSLGLKDIEKVVFVAGGVGINPLISMFGHMHETRSMPRKVEFLYSTKAADEKVTAASIPFLSRLTEIGNSWPENVELTFFLTGEPRKIEDAHNFPWHKMQRLGPRDLDQALSGDVALRQRTLCYVCGTPQMTDAFVDYLSKQEGMAPERVLCERWW